MMGIYTQGVEYLLDDVEPVSKFRHQGCIRRGGCNDEQKLDWFGKLSHAR